MAQGNSTVRKRVPFERLQNLHVQSNEQDTKTELQSSMLELKAVTEFECAFHWCKIKSFGPCCCCCSKASSTSRKVGVTTMVPSSLPEITSDPSSLTWRLETDLECAANDLMMSLEGREMEWTLPEMPPAKRKAPSGVAASGATGSEIGRL